MIAPCAPLRTLPEIFALADQVERIETVDVVDCDQEILTVAEAAAFAGASQETIQRWCTEGKIGRLFAGSLWLISRTRLDRYRARRRGRAVVPMIGKSA